MGVMMFEMVYGEVPFYSEQLTKMYGMIQNSANHLKFSEEAALSDEGKDFIRRWGSAFASFSIIFYDFLMWHFFFFFPRLVCDKSIRLGKTGVEEIKSHKWFKGINWETLRSRAIFFLSLPSCRLPFFS